MSNPAAAVRKGPTAQVLSMYAAITLGFGVVVGTALDPGLTGLGAVGPPIIQLPGETPPAAESPSGTVAADPPADSPTDSASFADDYGSGWSSGGSSGSGGGGGTKPKPKPKYLTGTVAQVNPYAGSYSLAIGGGPLTAVHASNPPEPGSTVKVKVVELFNGTYAQAAKPEIKPSSRLSTSRTLREGVASVKFTGTVSYRDAIRGLYTVSSLGVSALVHSPEDFLTTDVPEVGDLVQVDAEVRESPSSTGSRETEIGRGTTGTYEATGCSPEPSYPIDPATPSTRLVGKAHEVVLSDLTNYSISGIVQRSCEDDDQLIVSADDMNATGEDLDFLLTEEFDLDLVGLGQAVILHLQRDENGSLEILGLVSDQGRSGANDDTSAQGVTG